MELIRTHHSFAAVQETNGSGRRLMRAVLLTALIVGASWGCSSSSNDNGAKAGTGGRGGAGAVGGTGGKAGSASGAAGSAGTAAPVACGPSQCTVPANPLAGLLGGAALPATSVACCVDSAKGTCGTAAMTGDTCEPPAVADPRCPGIDLGALAGLTAMFGAGGAMTGCCVDNACGLDGALLGRGCVENSAAKGALGAIPGIGALINVPPALACDRPVQDAGAEDAGL
jgi:hypothetical protein